MARGTVAAVRLIDACTRLRAGPLVVAIRRPRNHAHATDSTEGAIEKHMPPAEGHTPACPCGLMGTRTGYDTDDMDKWKWDLPSRVQLWAREQRDTYWTASPCESD